MGIPGRPWPSLGHSLLSLFHLGRGWGHQCLTAATIPGIPGPSGAGVARIGYAARSRTCAVPQLEPVDQARGHALEPQNIPKHHYACDVAPLRTVRCRNLPGNPREQCSRNQDPRHKARPPSDGCVLTNAAPRCRRDNDQRSLRSSERPQRAHAQSTARAVHTVRESRMPSADHGSRSGGPRIRP